MAIERSFINHSPNKEAHQNGPLALLKSLALLLFGSFNGIQVFIYPGLLLYWLESDRLVSVAYDLLDIRVHYFPLTMFLLLGLYVIFMIAKHASGQSVYKRSSREPLSGYVVALHEKLLVVLICFALLFVLSGFLKYFYGIRLPVKLIASWTARVLGGLIILYIYLENTWCKPWLSRGHSFKAAKARVTVFARNNTYRFVTFNLFLLVTILLLSRIYVNMLEYVFHPMLSFVAESTGIEFQLYLLTLNSSLALVADVLMAGLALLTSNLFFIPLVWLAELAVKIMHPLRSV